MKKGFFLCWVVAFVVKTQAQIVPGYKDLAFTTYPFSSVFHPRGVETTSDGGYIICGQSNGTISGLATTQAIVMKLDQSFTPVWSRVLTPISFVVSNVVETDDYYVVGYQPANTAAYRIVSLDKVTGIIVYDEQFPGYLNSIASGATDTTILVCGRVQTPSFYTPGFQHSPYDGFVAEIGLEGDTLWTDRIGVMNKFDELTTVRRMQSSGYFVGGSRAPSTPPTSPPSNNSDAHIMRVSASGVAWAKKLDFFPVSNGGYASDQPYDMIVVDTMVYATMNLTGSVPNRGAVVAMSRTGNYVRTFTFGYGTPLSSYEVKTLSMVSAVDGGIVLVGYAKGSGFVIKMSRTLVIEWITKLPGTSYTWGITRHHSGSGYVVASKTSAQVGLRLSVVDLYGNAGQMCSSDTLDFAFKVYDGAVVTSVTPLQSYYPYEGTSNVTTNSTSGWVAIDSCAQTMVLPVELVSFDASALASSVLLEWVTATEQDNNYFEVLRGTEPWSIDEVVARVGGAGTSQETTLYQIYDDEPMIGTSYYQLRQVDFDGTVSYSQVEVVRFSRDDDLVLWPNPTTGVVYGLLGNTSFSVYDMMGRFVERSMSEDGHADISRLVAGTYFLQMDDGRRVKIQKE